MIRITGLNVPTDTDRRILKVTADIKSWQPVEESIEGGEELEEIFRSYRELRCSIADLRVAIGLVKEGASIKETFASLKIN